MTTEFIEKNVGILPFLWYSIKAHECLAQLGEHFLDVEGVMGSSPLALTLYCYGNPHKYAVFYFYLTKEISEHIAEISEKAIAYLRHSIARKVITKRFGK